MLEGVKPLDLSFLKNKPLDFSEFGGTSTGQTPSLQAIAKVIGSNTNWDAIKKDLEDKKGSPQAPTFWGGLMDLLSSGNYAVANGVNEAIHANASDKSDSVVSSILKSIGGGAKGALEGLGSGIASGVSAMTGTNDDIARDQTSKTRWSDIIQEHNPLDMAVKFDPETKQFSADGEVIDKGKAKRVGISNALVGLMGDIFLDPLTYVGGGALPKFGRGAKAVAEAADMPKNVLSAADELKDIKGLGKDGLAPSPLNEIPKPEPAINTSPGFVPGYSKNVSKFDQAPLAPVADNADPFASLLDDMIGKGELSAARKVGDELPTTTPVAKEITPATAAIDSLVSSAAMQQKLASKIGQFIAVGPDAKTLVKNVFGWLRSKHSGLEFPSVEAYMEKLRSQADPKFFNLMQKNPEFRKRVISGVHDAIKADMSLSTRAKSVAAREAKEARTTAAATAVPVKTAAEIIDDIAKGSDSAVYGEKLGKLFTKQDSEVFKSVVDDFADNINTGVFRNARDPEAVAAAVKRGTNVKWSGPTQVNVWSKILHRLGQTGQAKYFTKSRYTKALQMLRAFEDSYIAMGHTPMSGSKAAHSVPLRLSDVIHHIGLDNFVKHADLITTVLRSAFSGGEIKGLDDLMKTDPKLATAIHNGIEKAKASSAISEAPKVEQAITEGKGVAETIINENAASKAAVNEAVDAIQKTTKEIALNSGASLNGAKMAGNWIKDAFEVKDPVGSAIKSSKTKTLQALSGPADKGSLSLKFSNASSVTTAIGKSLGPISGVANKVGPGAKVAEWLGARFNAAYRNADLRPVYLANMASAKATVSRRAMQVNSLVHKFGNDGNLWNEALQVAQGRKTAASPEIEGLSKELQRVMEDLFGGSGLRVGAELENAVVGRAQILRKELNETLKRFGISHQFVNSGKYKNGVDWMKSWESWDVNNPLQMIYQIQNAVEMTVRTRAMFDEVISRFGSYAKKPGYTTKIAPGLAKEFPYLGQAHFPADMAEQANNFLKAFKEVNAPSSKLLQHIDSVMGKWKSSITIYRPAHYWRNLVGDMTFNWLAGVNSTRPYNVARKAMQSQKGRYDWETGGKISDLTGPDALKNAMKGISISSALGRGTAFTLKNGQKVTNDMFYIAAFQKGILPSARLMEDLPDKVPSFLDKFHLPGKMQGKGQEVAHRVHEQREHFIRLSHFADSMMKSGKNFEQAVEDAAAVVRKWHPDGMDLTSFERNKMRRLFPFYSWSRKAIPLAVESVYSSPGKTMLYPKLQYGTQQMIMGQNGGTSMSDPFPEDQLWPDWMREKGIGPLWGEAGDYTFLNPSNPIQDLSAQFGDVSQMIGNDFSARGISGITSMVNPALKLPAELMTGTNTMTGGPIKDWTQYATMQVPGLSDLSRASNVDLGGASPVADTKGFGNIDNILNYLTAAGIKQTTPKDAVSGQFAMRDYLKRLKEG